MVPMKLKDEKTGFVLSACPVVLVVSLRCRNKIEKV
jgi:hypothetical protein